MKVYLETDRLLLRNFTEDDLDNLVRLDSDPEVMRYINHGDPRDSETTRRDTLPRFLEAHEKFEHFGYFATIEKSTNEFIGWLHFRPAPENKILFRPGVDDPTEIELGYRLMRSVWGKGYATEGSRALIRKGFTELGVTCVIAAALVENRASTRVMEKVGLKLVEQYLHEELNEVIVKYALKRVDYAE